MNAVHFNNGHIGQRLTPEEIRALNQERNLKVHSDGTVRVIDAFGRNRVEPDLFKTIMIQGSNGQWHTLQDVIDKI